mgnify:CR=1 FL=1
MTRSLTPARTRTHAGQTCTPWCEVQRSTRLARGSPAEEHETKPNVESTGPTGPTELPRSKNTQCSHSTHLKLGLSRDLNAGGRDKPIARLRLLHDSHTEIQVRLGSYHAFVFLVDLHEQ